VNSTGVDNMKRVFDLCGSILGLFFVAPVLIPAIYLVWKQDGHSPFYIAPRIGLNGVPFKMVKLRSMVVGADKTGVDSTSSNDSRITPLGHFIRRFKLDELTQLWNVIVGDMSLVGPRPNVQRETDNYTIEELRLLLVKPGITDFSSIVFADEGKILDGAEDPDLTYNQIIRPPKNYLGLFYISHRSMLIDIEICLCTIISIFSREIGLKYVVKLLKRLDADERLIEIASRKNKLLPMPPPGGNQIVSSR
jgi:lipopolysaccharide/colanic/teichoic acid biosynthesis glycosyltransferase